MYLITKETTMKKYLDLCEYVLKTGIRKQNRTGVDHIGTHGGMLEFDLAEGFPIVTTRKMYFKTTVAEFLGFIRGYDNAKQFRNLGVKYWDANANENKQWLTNPNRKGKDDLGRIYGVQARRWRVPTHSGAAKYYDQLSKVVNNLVQHKDDRREIVSHWNPGELDRMALPPCHLLYQFGIQGDTLNMCMYQRSCDMPLGVPFDITGYAWLLAVIAQISRLKAGTFTHFLWDMHIYENQVELLKEQLAREPFALPTIKINPAITDIKDLLTWVTPEDFELEGYRHHEPINYPLAV
jgi:thymidylate synthase